MCKWKVVFNFKIDNGKEVSKYNMVPRKVKHVVTYQVSCIKQ